MCPSVCRSVTVGLDSTFCSNACIRAFRLSVTPRECVYLCVCVFVTVRLDSVPTNACIHAIRLSVVLSRWGWILRFALMHVFVRFACALAPALMHASLSISGPSFFLPGLY